MFCEIAEFYGSTPKMLENIRCVTVVAACLGSLSTTLQFLTLSLLVAITVYT